MRVGRAQILAAFALASAVGVSAAFLVLGPAASTPLPAPDPRDLAAAATAAPAPPPAPPDPAAGAFRVVLDPGHGGSNTGCAGVVEGVYEKRVVLAVTLDVAARLRAAGVDVVLTRTDDRYLTLRERVRLANAASADLFVSVHVNASPGRAQRGFETWVLDPNALEVDTRAIRAGDGAARPGVSAEIAAILDDAERGAALGPAVRVAASVQARLAEVWGPALSRGIRQGAQDVLMGLTMPGVLVEMGFLDHPVEGALLLEHATRDRLAAALVAAILDARAQLAAGPALATR